MKHVEKSSLISAKNLANLIKQGQNEIKIFDVRGTWKSPASSLYDDYLSEHISGAVFLDWTKHFLEQGVAVNLASVADFEEAAKSFAALGIHQDDLVILYDDYHHMFAGRIWWAMRYWGFENVRVLEGGLSYWKSQALPTSTDLPQIAEGSFKPYCHDYLRIGIEAFISHKESAYVIDARGAENYAGNPDDPLSGHIPGTINIPFKTLLDEKTGLFLPLENIQEMFEHLIPQWRTNPIISSCGSGYAGTIPLLALYNLGIEACLFDGSSAVWKQDLSREIEQSYSRLD